jgi:hypothetical protein
MLKGRTENTAGKVRGKWGKTIPKGAKRGEKERQKSLFVAEVEKTSTSSLAMS